MQHLTPTQHSTTTNDKTILTPEFIALVAQAIQSIQEGTWTGTNQMHDIQCFFQTSPN